MEKKGINAVCWHTSPSCARYLERLECHGEASPDELAAACHTQVTYAYALTRLMKSNGVIRVVAYRHNSMGAPTPIYALGPGHNRRMPRKESTASRCRRRKNSLVYLYGREIANKVLGNTHVKTQVVLDGRRLRVADHKAQLKGRVTR